MKPDQTLAESAFGEAVQDTTKLFKDKNSAYGNAYFRDEIALARYYGGLRRKFARLENHFRLMLEGRIDCAKESLQETYQDIAVYALMELAMIKIKNKSQTTLNNGIQTGSES